MKRIVSIASGAGAFATAIVVIPRAVAVVYAALEHRHDRVIDLAHEATRWALLVAGVLFLAFSLGLALRDPARGVVQTAGVALIGIVVALQLRESVPDEWLRAWAGADDGLVLALAGVGALWGALVVIWALQNRPRPCPACFNHVRPAARVCAACRTYLPSRWTGGRTTECPDCAEIILSDAKVCGHCGHRDASGAPLGDAPRPGRQEHAARPEPFLLTPTDRSAALEA